MNNTNANNNDNNMITITFFIQANPYHWFVLLLQKSDNSCILHLKNIKIQKKITDCVFVVRFLGQEVKILLQYLLFRICHHLCLSLLLIDSNIGKIG